jgi:hypothetical protein
MLWRVYIDESGDRGMSATSSQHFVTSAVIVDAAQEPAARAELAQLRLALGRDPGHALHFQKFSHSQRLKAVQDVAASSVAAISSVILCKQGFNKPLPPGELPYITNPDPMYLWAMRLLLERVSWFVRDHGGGAAVVTFAHVRHFKAEKLHSYRAALEAGDTQVHWPSFDGHKFRIGHPNRIELLQLADTTASALFRAIEPDEFGNVERRYLTELVPKVYRRGRNLTSYGLKTFPAQESQAGGSLAWLAGL